jgi:hypothetical protein
MQRLMISAVGGWLILVALRAHSITSGHGVTSTDTVRASA